MCNVSACQEYRSADKAATCVRRIGDERRYAGVAATRIQLRFPCAPYGMNRDVITDDGINYWKAANGQLFTVLISTLPPAGTLLLLDRTSSFPRRRKIFAGLRCVVLASPGQRSFDVLALIFPFGRIVSLALDKTSRKCRTRYGSLARDRLPSELDRQPQLCACIVHAESKSKRYRARRIAATVYARCRCSSVQPKPGDHRVIEFARVHRFSVRFGSTRLERKTGGVWARCALYRNPIPSHTEMVVVLDSNEIDREIAFSRYLRITLFPTAVSRRHTFL